MLCSEAPEGQCLRAWRCAGLCLTDLFQACCAPCRFLSCGVLTCGADSAPAAMSGGALQRFRRGTSPTGNKRAAESMGDQRAQVWCLLSWCKRLSLQCVVVVGAADAANGDAANAATVGRTKRYVRRHGAGAGAQYQAETRSTERCCQGRSCPPAGCTASCRWPPRQTTRTRHSSWAAAAKLGKPSVVW